MAKGKKQEDPNKVAQRKAERVAFVQSHPNLDPAVARERFYVQTRAQELSNAGKPVDRAALRQKFESGNVQREGFYTPTDVNRFNAANNGNSLGESKAGVTTPTTPTAPTTPVAPTTPTTSTSSVKTPPTSYQAPQTTTALGQVVQPSTSYMAPGQGTPVRGGEPGRGITPPALVRPTNAVPGGEPDRRAPKPAAQNGVQVSPATTNPLEGREFSSAVQRVFNANAPINAKSLAQQKGARLRAENEARIIASNPLRAAEQARIDAGYVPAPYDWTNMYRATAGVGVLAADAIVTGLTGSAVAGSIAAGVAENVKNRVGKAIEAKNGFGGVKGDPGYGSIEGEGDTSLKHAAATAAMFGAGHGLDFLAGKTISYVAPKLPGIGASIRDWAAGAVERESMTAAEQAAQRTQRIAAKGTSGKNVIQMPSRLEFSGINYDVVAGRSSIPSVESETAASVLGKMRQEPLAIGPIDNPGATKPLYGPPAPVKAKPAAVPFPESKTLGSGLVIPGVPKRNPVLQDALDEVLGKGAAQPPVSLADTKASIESQLAEDGVKTYDQMTTQEKRNFTRAQNKLKKSQEVELKGQDTTIGPSKPEPVPNVTPEPASTETQPLSVVKGNSRADQMRGHPSMGPTPEKPKLSVVQNDLLEYSTEAPTFPRGVENARLLNEQANLDKSLNDLVNSPEGVPLMDVMKVNPRTWEEGRTLNLGEGSIDNPIETKIVGESTPPAKRPPRQRPNETDATYAKRLDAWRVANEGEVFKAPAGFEQNRGSISYKEQTINRIEGGMSRTNRSRTTAFISEPGMSPEGFPLQMEGESVWDFNIRSSKWLRERGKATPVVPDNSFLAEGTPEPVSLGKAKEVAATGDIPPKPVGLKPNAAYDPETKTWRNRRLDKNTGEFVFTQQRVKFATEEERQAATAARELAKQERRKAARAAAATEIKTKAETIAASGVDNVEHGPFMFGGEPLGRSKVTLTPGEVPDWAQQNVSLTTPKPSEAESLWLNRVPTKEEEAYFRELGNAKKMSSGRRVVRGTREATPADIQEYVRRMKGVRGEEGITAGPDNVALTSGQQKLEKEIEQVLGTDALTAIKNIAVRGNTPPLTQNIRGIESLAEVKASGEPLLNKVVVRQPTPSASGRLREQAATFFNAQGKLKGVSGSDRMRTWNRLTQSDWFRQLEQREPTFANFLREQNSNLTEAFKTTLSEDVTRTLPKPKLRQSGWFGDKQMGPLEQKLAAQEFDQTLVDNGLGAYDLKGEELVTGVKPGNFSEGTTPAQRAEAASIEGRSQRFARLVEQVKTEDQAAFGDINSFNRGFGRGEQLDPMVDKNVTKDYGIVDQKGFTNINQSEFNVARRELNQPFQATPSSLNEAKGAEFEAQRKAIVDLWKQNKITKAEMNQQLLEARTAAFEAPSTGLPANPFQQEFGTNLPNEYVQQLPESHGKVWDPSTWTDEMGNKINGRWISKEDAAIKAQEAIDKQAANKLKVEEAWNRRHGQVDGKPWMQDAKERALATKNKTKTTSNYLSEEERRIASNNARAAKAKASSVQGKTAEQIGYELKNPVFGPPKPWNHDAIQAIEQANAIRRYENMSPVDIAFEEARLNAQDVLSEYESDSLDWIKD